MASWRPWSSLETTIARAAYKTGGVPAAQAALTQAGFPERSEHSIRGHIARNKTKRPRSPKASKRLTPKERALFRRFPTDPDAPFFDVDFDPIPATHANVARLILSNLERKRLVKLEGDGLYRLTLRGLLARRELTRGDDA